MSIGKTLDRLIGNPFRALQGTKRCNTPEKLLRYMKGKDLDALHFWCETRMWYTPDDGKPWRQNWTPIREVLARDVYGSEIESDCEERGVARKFVVNELGWGRAYNLVVWADNDKRADGSIWCHAACLVKEWTGRAFCGIVLMDYKMHQVSSEREAVMVMGRDHRVTPTRWCFCNDQGKIISEIFQV